MRYQPRDTLAVQLGHHKTGMSPAFTSLSSPPNALIWGPSEGWTACPALPCPSIQPIINNLWNASIGGMRWFSTWLSWPAWERNETVDDFIAPIFFPWRRRGRKRDMCKNKKCIFFLKLNAVYACSIHRFKVSWFIESQKFVVLQESARFPGFPTDEGLHCSIREFVASKPIGSFNRLWPKACQEKHTFIGQVNYKLFWAWRRWWWWWWKKLQNELL